MARRKSTPPAEVAAEIVRFPHIAAPLTDASEDRRDQELDDLIEQLGSDSKIVVYHVIEGKGQPTYAGPMPIEGFSLEGVLETYGGGDKAITVYQAGKKVGTWRVSLDPSVPATSPRAKMAARMVAGSGVAPAGTNSDIIEKIMLMQASSADMLQKTMIGIMGAVSTMLTTQRPQSSDLDTVVKIAEVLKGSGGPAPATSELFAVFKEGIAIASRLNENGDDGTLGVVREGLAVVGKIVENNARGPAALPAAPAPRSLPPAPVSNGAAPSPEPTAPVQDRPWIAAILPAAPLVFSMVGAVRPATAAQAIADRLDETQFEDLLTDIESGTPQEFVTRLLARFGATATDDQYRWLLQLVQDVKAMVEEESSDDLGERDGDHGKQGSDGI